MLGAIAIPVSMSAVAPLGVVVFAVLASLSALRSESRAFAGGLLAASGLWWVYYVRQAVERCEAFNRQPQGSCAIYGTEEQLALAGLLSLIGAVLIVAALVRGRATP